MTYPSDPNDPWEKAGDQPGQPSFPDSGYPQSQNPQSPYPQQPGGYPQGYPQQPAYGYPAPQQPGYPGPGFGQGPARGPAPDNYLVWAILATVLCCLPLGIVSIVKANSVNTLWAQGDVQGAHDAANSAKSWAIWSAVIGVAVTVVVVIVYIIVIAVAVNSGVDAPDNSYSY